MRMTRKLYNRQGLRFESLENRFCLDGMPLLWMEDNNGGNAGGLPADFVRRFEDPVTWQVALRTIDTFYVRESSLRNTQNLISQEVLQNKIAPVLNAAQTNVAIDSGAATFLNRRSREQAMSVDVLLSSHFQWLDLMIQAGLRVKTISLQSVLSKTVTGDREWADYSISDRISDVIEYSARLKSRFPNIQVGIIDALPTHKRNWTSIYDQLSASMRQRGLSLDHIHLDMPVDYINTIQRFSWQDVFNIQQYVKQEVGAKFGLMLTSRNGGGISNEKWATESIQGLFDYQTMIRQLGNPNDQPDRIIISSWYEFPDRSVPELMPLPVTSNVAAYRIRSTNQVVVQSTNLLRGLNDYAENRLQLELTQVFPVAASASSTFSASNLSPENAVFARGVVDARESQSQFQWRARSGDLTPWIKASLPKIVNVDRVRIWPFQGGANHDGRGVVDVYVSKSGTGNPITNSAEWVLVDTVNTRATLNAFDDATFPIQRATAVALRFRDSIGSAGVAAIRVFSPNSDWNAPYVSPLVPAIPTVATDYDTVYSGVAGSPIVRLLINDLPASGNYVLSVDDSRFEFRGNELRLKTGVSLDHTVTPGLAIWTKLVNRSNPNQSFSKLVSFLVYPQIVRSQVFDYGDAPVRYPVTFSQNGARHLAIGPKLGVFRDPDKDGTPGEEADLGTDDDGVQFAELQAGNLIAQVTLKVTNVTAPVYVDAWIDFNNDGEWDNDSERVLNRVSVSNGNNVRRFSVPANVTSGTTVARVRISSLGTSAPTGSAFDGEVEDYLVDIIPPDFSSRQFISQTISTTTNGARSVQPADMDGDGDFDLVTASELDSNVRVLVNDGRQNFREIIIGSVAFATSVSLVDMDADGDMDILAAAYGNENFPGLGNELILFRNTGNMTFSRSVIATGLIGVFTVTASDLDMDGDMDALIAASLGNWTAWVENLGNSFQVNLIGRSVMPRGITAGDFDQDGDQDVLVAVQGDYQIILYRNDGARNFVPIVIDRFFAEAYDAVFADMDRDGDLDIVAGQLLGDEVRWYENQGRQVFVQRVLIKPAPNVKALQVVDMDGDGLLDVLTTQVLNNKIVWHRNLGGLRFEDRLLSADALWAQQTVAVDLDQDGDLDVVAASWTDDRIQWFEQVPVDMGDAPLSFADPGLNARHRWSGLKLGTRLDADNDPQPSILANADDRDPDGDDEDGIRFTASLRASTTPYTASIIARASTRTKLDAWIDFNGNGRFDNPSEHLWAGQSQVLVLGQNSIRYVVPANLSPGPRIARFRISSQGSLTPNQDALDGEVEDYSVEVANSSRLVPWLIGAAYGPLQVVITNSLIKATSQSDVVFEALRSVESSISIEGDEEDNMIRLSTQPGDIAIQIDGGEGFDTLQLIDTDAELDWVRGSPITTRSIEKIDIRGTNRQKFCLSEVGIAANVGATGTLWVVSDALDDIEIPTDWRIAPPRLLSGEFAHQLLIGTNTMILQNANPWTNPVQSLDVNADGSVDPLDVLVLINHLNAVGSSLLTPPVLTEERWSYLDSNSNGFADPLDVLAIINNINGR